MVFFEHGAQTQWLVEPLIQGFVEGNSAINALVGPSWYHPSDYLTILMWVCQTKFLEGSGWQGSDNMLSLVLATPGIQANYTLPNGTNAAFFVVK